METTIALGVLALAWTCYFLYCLRETRKSRPASRRFSPRITQRLGALGSSVSLETGKGLAGPQLRHGRMSLTAPPQSRIEANRRRNQIGVALVLLALGTLALVPTLGVAGWVLHIAVDIALLSFAVALVNLRQQNAQAELMDFLPRIPPAPQDQYQEEPLLATGTDDGFEARHHESSSVQAEPYYDPAELAQTNYERKHADPWLQDDEPQPESYRGPHTHRDPHMTYPNPQAFASLTGQHSQVG